MNSRGLKCNTTAKSDLLRLSERKDLRVNLREKRNRMATLLRLWKVLLVGEFGARHELQIPVVG